MTNDVSGARTSTGSPGPAGSAPATGAPRPWRPWGLIVVVAMVVSAVAGAFAQHAVDQHKAAITLYRHQINTTASRFFTEEERQLALPAAQRSDPYFSVLADSISKDPGVNDSGNLTVSVVAGSTKPAHQIAYAVNVSSPHGSSTFVVWDIRLPGVVNQGTCLLSSSLLGPGPATRDLELGGNEFLGPCQPRWWAPGPVDGRQPRLGLTPIPKPGR
jgi:hypothetical protein